MSLVLDMAKKKPVGAKEEAREELIAVRCKSSYKAWVLRLAKANRTTPSQLVDLALIEYAAAHGFTEKAPER